MVPPIKRGVSLLCLSSPQIGLLEAYKIITFPTKIEKGSRMTTQQRMIHFRIDFHVQDVPKHNTSLLKGPKIDQSAIWSKNVKLKS